MMYVNQFEVFRCTNRSIMAAQRSQTSRFSVGFSGGNSEQTVKQPKEVFSTKHRCTLLESCAWLLVQNNKTLKTNPLTLASYADALWACHEYLPHERLLQRALTSVLHQLAFVLSIANDKLRKNAY